MARRGYEVDTETFDVVDGIIERDDFYFAAVAGTGVHLADGERASQGVADGVAESAGRLFERDLRLILGNELMVGAIGIQAVVRGTNQAGAIVGGQFEIRGDAHGARG